MSAAAASGVVFDKDGTLIDLDRRWAPFFNGFVRAVAGADRTLERDLLELLGVRHDRLIPDRPAAVETGRQIRRRVIEELARRGRSRAASGSAVEHAYRAASLGPLTPIGDVASTLRRLGGRGVRLGVATSDDRRNTLEELDALGVGGLIETIRCGDQEPVKPDPAVLVGIADEWGLTPAELLFVGDSRQDLDTARAAGWGFVAVANGEPPGWSALADWCVASIDGLWGGGAQLA